MSRPAVVVMCKAPRAGEVKTRLTPFLSAADAAALAACMFQDSFRNAARATREVLVAYAPDDGRAALEALLRAESLAIGVQFFEQRGADLGERLEAAAAHAFARGFAPVLIKGTDTFIPAELLAAALRALSAGDADLALGPAEDGGYYLVGLRSPAAPGLFRGVAWSTALAYRQTADNASRLALRLLEVLPRLPDVDTPADFERLRRELLADPERALLLAPSTYRWLEKREDSGQ
ncbi:MAG: TIGR04282 family arsenosugar biosynthesis glycosyltransferase [Acidobacteria bacterium]|nr:TIGR04282 family arsenosugar biosynthesis glycosyltransferase [Acidobacteriota bacterium]